MMTAAEKEEAKRQQEKDDLRAVMSTPAGRRVVWSLLERARIFRACFVPGDTTKTIYNEGRRECMLPLLAKLTTWCPDLYAEAEREYLKNHDNEPMETEEDA